MQKTKFTVYWTTPDGFPSLHTSDDMNESLNVMSSLRKDPNNSAIVMACENADRIGEDGVDEVKDGKTPDGVEYTWNKNSRIGATRK